jgi:hypothetical protein
MKTVLFLLLSACLCFGADKKAGTNPTTLITRLRDDVKQAMTGPEVKDKDKQKLTKAIAKLDKNLDARAQGKPLNNGDIHKALDDIGSVSKSFREEDKNTVYEDMRNIRDKNLDKVKEKKIPQQRRTTISGPRIPNPRRY